MTEDRLLDIRTIKRNIKAGKVGKEDYQKYLESLEIAPTRRKKPRLRWFYT